MHGDSLQSELVAIVVPDPLTLNTWAKSAGLSGSVEQLCQLPRVKELILSRITSVGAESKVAGFEMIKAIHLEPHPFDAENDLLTPTFKLKRPVAQKKYQKVVDQLYQDLEMRRNRTGKSRL